MDFLTLAEARYSARSFAPRAVEPALVAQVLEAARLAPTAMNCQPQRILVLDDPAVLEKLAMIDVPIQRFHAPLCFVVCYDVTASGKRPFDHHDYGLTDASIVATHMMLAIAAVGLGSTWVGHFPPDLVRDALALPPEWVPVALLPTGYPDAAGAPSAHHSLRRPVEEIAWHNAAPQGKR